jgi:predicted amino acid dehydrogenase
LKRLILLVRPIKSDTIHGITIADGRQVQVHLVVVPWLPEMIKEHPELAVRRAIQAAEVARDLGARCLGLGAYWSVVGNKGQDVAAAAPFIPITNGGAYTAGTVKQAVPMVLSHLEARRVDPPDATAAVVGANGVVGFGICRQLVGRVGRLLMLGTDTERLERSAALLRRRSGGTEIVVATDLDVCVDADMIFTATSTVAPVLFERHVKPGAVIYDLGRPADVDEAVTSIPGVTVIPGGVVRPPGRLRHRLDVHFGPGQIPACMAETILIALDECFERVSLGGDTKSEHIDYFVDLAERYGFEVMDDATVPEAVLLPRVPVHA